ncbi:Mth938-like domain-containing protein [Methylobacillus arboreus]|uniref:Mth938-like domain-containing protein n=1 Tax=Methylobacillus arboreus TaxID=755170 RepID=UPI001E2B0C72|nr:Mth938-like domain-containing protein [Methylobacillus arboreus]MCB5191724.1 Mth938-like domain-containing protein [Methylobacillus arboreus]
MKLHLTQAAGSHLITGYGDGWVEINHARHEHSLIVLPSTLLPAWPVDDFDSLAPEHFSDLLALKPELILLGTGSKHRFLHPSISGELIAAGISVECMTTEAACRTYNILMAESRQVAAALIV